jgi:hypothetical protein
VRALLFLCFPACLLFTLACGRQPAKGISVDPAFRTLIAPDTKLLAGVDWDSLKTTAFYQRHQKDINIPQLGDAAERMGVDPRRDISKLLVAWDGKSWLVVERGRFNASDVQKKLIAQGIHPTDYHGHTLLGDTGTTLVFFKSVAAEGSSSAVHRAIDLESKGEGEIPEDLQERLRTLSKNDQLWTVSRAGLAYANFATNSDLQTALSNITGSVSGTTAGVFVDSGIHLSIDLQCVSDQGATRVHDALRGLIGFGRLSTKDNEQDLLRAYDAIQVNKANQIVQVRADLPGDLADKLITTVSSLRRGR